MYMNINFTVIRKDFERRQQDRRNNHRINARHKARIQRRMKSAITVIHKLEWRIDHELDGECNCRDS